MDNRDEIRQANRKAMPKFILLMVISVLVGGGFGVCAAEYGFDALASGMKAAGAYFGIRIAPWLMLAIALVLPMIFVPLYARAKKLLAGWDGEDEAVSDGIETRLSALLWITNTAFILAFFLIAATYSGGFATFDHAENILPFFVSIGAMVAILIESTIFQQKCVDTTKKMNPEKTASVYDTHFQKKWIDSCDEAEKLLIGKCAIRAYQTTSSFCAGLAVLLAVGALVFDIGFLPSLVVCAIWLVNQSAYCREAMKYCKTGNKVQF